jgi:hypothetical protein
MVVLINLSDTEPAIRTKVVKPDGTTYEERNYTGDKYTLRTNPIGTIEILRITSTSGSSPVVDKIPTASFPLVLTIFYDDRVRFEDEIPAT